MKKHFLNSVAVALLMLATPAVAQISHGGQPALNHGAAKVSAPDMLLSRIDNDFYLQQDINAVRGAGAMRVGVLQDVDIDVVQTAAKVSDGQMVRYLLSITSPEAKYVSLIFSDFVLPEGAELYVYDATGDFVLGSFNASDVKDDGTFYTQAIPGEVAYVEYAVPAGQNPGRLKVNQVCHGYKDIFVSISSQYDQAVEALKGSHGYAEGNCHINVICEEADDWRDQIRSVVALEMFDSRYSYMCTGSLINNTRNDGTPYILTAYHCQDMDGGVRSWTAYFLYETRTCEGNTGPGNKSVTGAVIMAKYTYETGSDFCLIRLNNAIPDTYTPYYSGWNRADVAQASLGACIHHPGGDFKKISFPREVRRLSGSNLPFYRVYWYTGSQNKGVTEQGSSGSPLFNADKQIIGQLYAGTSGCDYMSGYDLYGRLFTSWAGDGTSTGRLSNWLDPTNSQVVSIEGIDYQDVGNVGIDPVEANKPLSLKVYPNPTHGTVHFDIDALGEANYKVFDLSGRCVKEGRTVLTTSSQAVNLSSLPAGTYTLCLYASSRNYTATVVVK